MSERDEIAREVIPFLEDLFPGISASIIISILRIAFLGSLVVLVVSVLIYVLTRLVVLKQSERYLKNLNVLKSIDNLECNEEEKKSIRKLILDCVILGAKIDFHTNRKNNSKLVSQIIWKMSAFYKFEIKTAILYTCAAMVYDVGFLDVNAIFFHAEVLSPGEKKTLRAHIMNSYEHLLFVPEEIRSLFFEAAMFHHENFNGSGYPESLKADEIPQVAQMIRVAESYVSLVSRRSYRKFFTRENALKELEGYSQNYSPEYFDCLKKIV